MSKKRAVAGQGRTGRVVAARIEPGQDTVETIIELIKESGFKAGTVTAIGSLLAATVMLPHTTDMNRPLSEIISPYTMEGPVELGIGWGIFGTDADGQVLMHIHGLILDKQGNMRCGNLVPGSAPVMVTVDLTIQELLDLEIRPVLNPVLGHKLLNPMTLG